MRLWRKELIPWSIVAALLPLLSNRLQVEWPALLLIGLIPLVLIMLLGELSHARMQLAQDESFDTRPPDGLVPLVEIPRIVRQSNSLRPEIGPYLTTEGATESPPNHRRRGVKHLKGRIALASLFVGRDGYHWDEREVVEAYDAMERAGLWMEREATRWGVPLNIERFATYFLAEDSFEEIVELADGLDAYESVIDERDADLKSLTSASRAAASLGFSHFGALIETVGNQTERDAIIWVVYLMRAGRSSAIPPGRFDLPGDGTTICYAREAPFSEPLSGLPYVDPVTLAHELLHQFGATDKYGTSLKTFPNRSVTRKDVMRLDIERLSRLRIDPLTASEIGWQNLADRK